MPVAYLRLPHDSAFKRFVLNSHFIRHLIQAYPVPGLEATEVLRIEPANPNIVDRFLKQRFADAIWRLEMRDGSIVILLFECQSREDPTMPLRALHAVAGVYLALSEHPLTEFGYSVSCVPQVRCLVVHSGEVAWTGPIGTLDVIATDGGQAPRDVPRMTFVLIDLRRCVDPGGGENTAVLLVRMQACDDPDELSAAAEPLRQWLGQEWFASLGQAFASWISYVRLPSMGVEDAPRSDNLEEVLDMLQKAKETWADRMRREGKLELLLSQARHRFGDEPVEKLAALLHSVSDPDRIEEIGQWILDCPTDEALLAQLG